MRQLPVNFVHSLVFALLLLAAALALGTMGYYMIAHLGWIDAILDAAMILTGMGPVAVHTTDAAKLFAAAYALFSGVVFLTMTGIALAPVVYRVLYKFNVEDREY
ncbi:MAG: hypothetical protein HYX63_19465 [Gammaproteobacteria bacterium]|nr:hypothetical protein [Gammaproteobacteria bacterium]